MAGTSRSSPGPPAPPGTEELATVRGGPVHLWVGGSGPSLLFLHGAGSIGQSWTASFPLLARHHRVLLPDLPGFGLSPDNDRIETFAELAEAIAELIRDRAGPPIDLAGNSMGGGLAAGVALAHPELVRSLILVAPGGLLEREDTRSEADRLVPGEVNRGLFHRPERGAATFPTLTPEEVRARWAATRRALKRWLAQGLTPVPFDRLRVPTLVLWGREDRILPSSWASEIADRIPAARAVVLDDCGHVPQLELPEAFTATVEAFLSTLPAGRSHRHP